MNYDLKIVNGDYYLGLIKLIICFPPSLTTLFTTFTTSPSPTKLGLLQFRFHPAGPPQIFFNR